MSEIRGVGLDLCEISRMEAQLHTHFLDRNFTEDEAAYIRSRGAQAAQTMAGLWAAKEAVLKALGTGIAYSLKEVEVCHTQRRQPFIRLHGKVAEDAPGSSFLLSITHEAGMAAAVAIWQQKPDVP